MKNKITDINKIKELTNSYTEAFFNNGNFINKKRALHVSYEKNELLMTKYVSLQLANLDQEGNNAKVEELAMKNQLSTVNFKECEAYLRANGYLMKNEILSYAKTDWNNKLQTADSDNANMKKSSSTSFRLFTESGKAIDMSLCASIPTKFNIHLKNTDQLNLTRYDEISKMGFNIYDTKSPYYSDFCIPIRKNQSEAIFNDSREKFDNFTAGCNGKCTMEKIDSKTGYINSNVVIIRLSKKFTLILGKLS